MLGKTIESEDRPWGSFALLADGDQTLRPPICGVKILVVDAGESLSLQTHRGRHERWVALDGGLEATIGGITETMVPGEAYDVPAGVTHRLANPSRFSCRVVEVLFGVYDEADVVRLHDVYGRP